MWFYSDLSRPQIVDIVHGQMGKRPMMWSPLVWDPDAPPAKLVEANAVLNLWTGPIAELANNITLKRTNELVLSNVRVPSLAALVPASHALRVHLPARLYCRVGICQQETAPTV